MKQKAHRLGAAPHGNSDEENLMTDQQRKEKQEQLFEEARMMFNNEQ